ncbi:MAG: hypothetical protein AAGG48_30555 [Planctomycetota bacterium]
MRFTKLFAASCILVISSGALCEESAVEQDRLRFKSLKKHASVGTHEFEGHRFLDVFSSPAKRLSESEIAEISKTTSVRWYAIKYSMDSPFYIPPPVGFDARYMKALGGNLELGYLSIPRARITSKDTSVIRNFTKLRTLDIRYTDIDGEIFRQISSSHFDSLLLSGTDASHELSKLPSKIQVESILASGAKLDADDLLQLSRVLKLKRLYLSNVIPVHDGLDRMEFFGLAYLDLSQNKPTDSPKLNELVRHFLDSSDLLKKIDLRGIVIDESIALRLFKRSPGLTYLVDRRLLDSDVAKLLAATDE